jgi:hypothetical protein
LDTILYTACGLTAGLLGGYLGLGGGFLMVPFMTIVMGMDIKAAAPLSLGAVVVGSQAASSAYLKKNMIDNELVIVLGIFMAIGSVTGSVLSSYIPSDYIQLVFSVLMIYTAVMLLTKRNNADSKWHSENKSLYYGLAAIIALAAGTVAAILGIGGGIFIIPILYLLFGKDLGVARGTSSMLIGFSTMAASAVYLMTGRMDATAVVPLMLGVSVGGIIGGKLGTLARPGVVKALFCIIMLLAAYNLGSKAVVSLF